MKISIITSCYNREATIGEAMHSVLSQDYDDIEYIIVDGASTDRSLQIIEKEKDCFEERHRTIKVISEPDRGMYEALNKGIRMATGDVIALVHSDDVLYDSRTVSDVVCEIERTGCDFLYADGLFVDAEKTDRMVRNWIGGRYSKWKVRHGWLPLHPTCYIHRDVMMRLGLYDESYKIAADTDLLVRYLLENDLKVNYLRRYVVRMRMGGLSTDNSRRAKMWREDIRVYKSHGFKHVTLTKIEKMMWKVPQFFHI